MSLPILACTDQGNGPPIVLLHGFPLSLKMWDAEVKAWRRNFRVIAPDFRGFGDSPMAAGEFSMAGCAQDLRDLLASLRIQQEVVLLGLSMGGYISFEFVREHQEMLRGLILVGTQPVADSDAARQARYETADFVRREGTALLADRLIPRFLGRTTLATKPAVVETVRSLIQSNSPEAIAQACYGLASRRDSTSFLADIKLPTLLVAGAEDALIASAQAEMMHRQVRQSRLVVVEQCGHLINLEQPQVLDQAVSSFLKQL
ncbi:MAG: alpha/beta hydrolase [Acidobacteria bacterium]|nr:alpha/beta hydrolase [Acidobacteriota bacterium]